MISQGNAINAAPNPTVAQVAVPTANPYEAQLVTLSNVTISGMANLSTPPQPQTTFQTQNLSGTITDSSGSMEIFYWPSSYSVPNNFFAGLAIPTTPVTLTGFISLFNGAQEFVPISEVGNIERFTAANDASVPVGFGSPYDGDGYGNVNRGTAVNYTITRTGDSTQVGSVGIEAWSPTLP